MRKIAAVRGRGLLLSGRSRRSSRRRAAGSPGLAVLATTQPRYRRRSDWLRRPPGDAPGEFPCLRIVGDPGEPPTQLDSGRQLSLLIEDRADRSGICLGDNEHPISMVAHPVAGKHGMHRAHAGCVRQSEGANRPPRPGSGWYRLNTLSRVMRKRLDGVETMLAIGPRGMRGRAFTGRLVSDGPHRV
jgi:hypothetical protein